MKYDYERIHSNMLTRCNNKKSINYKYYGGRGITVCDRWSGKGGLANFYNDMGKRPSKKHTLDRIDTNKGYYKQNCRWATWDLQNINRRKRSDNKSSVPGVNFNKVLNKWHARISYKKVRYHLGFYKSIDEAIKVRQIKQKELWG